MLSKDATPEYCYVCLNNPTISLLETVDTTKKAALSGGLMRMLS